MRVPARIPFAGVCRAGLGLETWGVIDTALVSGSWRAISHGQLKLGTLSVGVGLQYADKRVTGQSGTDPQAFVQWTWDFSGLLIGVRLAGRARETI